MSHDGEVKMDVDDFIRGLRANCSHQWRLWNVQGGKNGTGLRRFDEKCDLCGILRSEYDCCAGDESV